MNVYMRRVLLLIVMPFLITNCSSIDEVHDYDLKRIKYQNPGLVVDLGVGLWSWPLPMDYDNDGDMDLVVSSLFVASNGTFFFENKSDENSNMTVFAPPVKIGPGKHHIQVSHVNGEPRVTSQGTEYRDFRKKLFEDPVELFEKDSLEKQHKFRVSQWKYVDYENDGDLDIIVGMDDWTDYGWDNAFNEEGNWTNGPLHGYVYLLENQDGSYINRGKIKASGKSIDVYGPPSPNMADFDGDGDLDLILGDFLDRFTWFENVGTRENPKFTEGRLLRNNDGVITMEVEMVTPSAVDWDQDGDIDLIVGEEPGHVAFMENTGEVKNNMPVFESPKYFKQEAEYVKFGALATPYSVDWDNDGDEDLIVGNTAGYIGFFENLDGGNSPTWAAPKLLKANGEVIRIMAGENGSIQGPAEQKWGYTTLSVADWDHDGLKDIIVNSIWGKVQWYKNIGTKTEPELAAAQPVKISWEGDLHKPEWNWWDPEKNNLVTQWRTTPYTIDWNEDGLMDLVMLDQEGYLAYYERFQNENDDYILKPGERIFYGTNASGFDAKHNVTDSTAGPLRLNTEKYGSSGRRKFTFADWDKDGNMDLLVNSENISLLENTRAENGKVYFTNRGTVAKRKLAGHTTSPTTVDWNNDGVPDLLIGGEDGYLYYLQNSKN